MLNWTPTDARLGREQTLIKLKLGVIQKRLATCSRKALTLKASGTIEREVRKQMFVAPHEKEWRAI